MKICGKCHNEYSDDLNFCHKDGSLLEPVYDGSVCPHCKSPFSARSNEIYSFCPFCGKKLFRSLRYGTTSPGDIIKFGQWPRSADKRFFPIDWIVLDITEKDMLLTTRYLIDAAKYGLSDEDPSVNWEESGIRVYLNMDFYLKAFNDKEKKLILKNETYIDDSNYSVYDNVFLLSIREAEKYFRTDEDRKAIVTPYAVKQGIYVRRDSLTSWWWLRDVGKMTPLFAAFIGADGDMHTGGNYMDSVHGGVRPAIRIRLH